VYALASAYVLINTELGQEPSVFKALESVPEVVESHQVYGVYDIIVKVETESMEELKEILHQRLRRMVGIRSTLTMIVS
jgi:Lrp/AsnC family transcriptional regulator for asnA, asnC and gidA